MNLFAQLKRLLPDEPVLVGRVIARDLTNDTSTVELPGGASTVVYAGGLSTGRSAEVRGSGVTPGARVFMQGGVIQSLAPEVTPLEIVIGRVIGP